MPRYVAYKKHPMPNPWLKKNPFMSIWLSAANRVSGSLRGQAVAQVKHQVNAAVTKAARENLGPASLSAKPAAAKTKRPR